MTNSIIIRPITVNDYKPWLSLWDAYNHFYADNVSKEITQTTWLRFLDVNAPIYALVAEQEGVLVGFAHYLFHLSTIRINMNCYLQDLFVAESVRNVGIGHKLITAVCEQAKEKGSPRIYWFTDENNIAARKLHDKIAEQSDFIVYQKSL